MNQTSGAQLISAGSLAAAVVSVADYYGHLAAPALIIAAETTVLTAVFMYLWWWLPKKKQ